MISTKLTQLAIAVGVGVGTGIYVFKPLLQEYEQETNGTWLRPGDKQKLRNPPQK
ncbi:uncharacterized protein B0P05DRAFT_552457 [Gilbertella persicaria]|uniref:uncharacterized protein n=1 Tax=Gilbertella persicaria TaxID=101096 RepID=UPI002220C7B6|nr:uncharacterized protein B0P05DRAFT_552457 [Gilbertella persicaria]KAI8067660.1 hypothetical protein B0P05DRAFT_552457 [Gilbertella persicaria]